MKRLPFVLGALLLAAGAVAGVTPVSAERVSARLAGSNGAAWSCGYDAAVTGEAVIVRVGIHLIPSGVTRTELERASKAWEEGIRRAWSRRFALELPTGERLPIVVEPSFRGPDFHHDVVVRQGRRWADQLDWGLGNTPETAAHEFGHMLGAFDDYRGGATAPSGDEIDSGSLMTSLPGPTVAVRARHLEGIRQWFGAKTGLDARVVAIPTAAEASGCDLSTLACGE